MKHSRSNGSISNGAYQKKSDGRKPKENTLNDLIRDDAKLRSKNIQISRNKEADTPKKESFQNSTIPTSEIKQGNNEDKASDNTGLEDNSRLDKSGISNNVNNMFYNEEMNQKKDNLMMTQNVSQLKETNLQNSGNFGQNQQPEESNFVGNIFKQNANSLANSQNQQSANFGYPNNTNNENENSQVQQSAEFGGYQEIKQSQDNSIKNNISNENMNNVLKNSEISQGREGQEDLKEENNLKKGLSGQNYDTNQSKKIENENALEKSQKTKSMRQSEKSVKEKSVKESSDVGQSAQKSGTGQPVSINDILNFADISQSKSQTISTKKRKDEEERKTETKGKKKKKAIAGEYSESEGTYRSRRDDERNSLFDDDEDE
ncbi:MAG: hypothetical protein MJ252_31235, partial [archaeon]|nr:hypothetical protein [archaeon]